MLRICPTKPFFQKQEKGKDCHLAVFSNQVKIILSTEYETRFSSKIAKVDEAFKLRPPPVLFPQRNINKSLHYSRHSSETRTPSPTAPTASNTTSGAKGLSFRRSVLHRPPAKSNSPLKTTDCVLDEVTSQVQRLGSFNCNNRLIHRQMLTASIKRKRFLQTNGSIVQHSCQPNEDDPAKQTASKYHTDSGNPIGNFDFEIPNQSAQVCSQL